MRDGLCDTVEGHQQVLTAPRWESGGQSELLLAFYSAYFTQANLGRLPTKDQPLVILSGGGRPILIREVLLLLPR